MHFNTGTNCILLNPHFYYLGCQICMESQPHKITKSRINPPLEYERSFRLTSIAVYIQHLKLFSSQAIKELYAF